MRRSVDGSLWRRMKIPASIRSAHADQLEDAYRLREKVDAQLRSKKDRRWHYESRVKSLESFAQKLESGRFRNPRAVEDLFACTLVVPNLLDVAAAEKTVTEVFALQYRRPQKGDQTRTAPESFPFDDLRLYVRWKDDDATPPTGLTSITFEVQVKTFLQHAWSIATHDLIYKTAEVHWGKQRIAYQIRAMLEHAELSIQEAERLATNENLQKTTRRTEGVRETIALLKSMWEPGDLPEDLRRLAENVNGLCRALSLDLEELRALLDEETQEGRGTQTLNLSPYAVVVQSLARRRWDKLKSLMDDENARATVLLPAEVELPEELDRSALRNAVLV